MIRADMRRYDWSFSKSLRVNFWWRIEHVGYYRGGEGGLFGYVRRWGTVNRYKAQRL